MEHHPSRSPASGDAVPQVLRGWLQAFRPHVIGRTWQNLLLVMGALLAPGGSAPRHHLGALRRKPLAIIFVARREPVQWTLMLIAQHGAVYGRNFGDVLIQKQLADELRARLNARVFFPQGTSAFQSDSGGDIRGKWRLPFASFVIFGPGGYLGERRHDKEAWNRRLARFHGSLFRKIRLLRIPSAIFGVGIGPLSDPASRSLVRDILDYSRFIHLRDEDSAAYAADHLGIARERISVGPDIALSLDRGQIPPAARQEVLGTAGTPPGRRVGIHLPVSGFAADELDRLAADVAAFAATRRDMQFLLLLDNPGEPFHPRLDRLAEEQENVLRVSYTDPARLLATIESCDCVVTNKLHVGICAAALGCNPIAAYTHPKVIRFYRQIGRERFCVDLAKYESPWISKVLEEALSMGAGDIVSTAARLRSEVSQNIGRLSGFLDQNNSLRSRIFGMRLRT